MIRTVNSGPRDWLRVTPARDRTLLRLVCIPHAGGGPSAFAGWARLVPDHVELAVAQLPGRETRLREAPPSDLDTVVTALAKALPDPVPTVVFGHSWGAALAFELSHRLRSEQVCDVVHLVVSGAPAPHCPRRLPRLAHLPRADLLNGLAVLNGVPAEVLRHSELMDLLIPALRADLLVAEAYRPSHPHPLSCPMTVLGGSDDPLTTLETLNAWQEYSVGPVRTIVLPGDHFFYLPRKQEVIAATLDVPQGPG